MTRTVILIPTYNEAGNLSPITKALFELNVEGLEILVIDDASPDGTGKLADQLAEQSPGHFYVLHRAGKMGIGTAYVEGFHWALERGADYLIQMDADFSHSPEHIPQMLDAIREYDLVVGSRYVKGGRLDEQWGAGRKFLSWWANSVWVHLILGMKTRDATTGFKCWRADALRQIKIERVRSNGYIFLVEICYLAEKLGLRIKEIPIYFAERHHGKSKMSTRIQVEAALRVFEIRRRYRRVGKEA